MKSVKKNYLGQLLQQMCPLHFNFMFTVLNTFLIAAAVVTELERSSVFVLLGDGNQALFVQSRI